MQFVGGKRLGYNVYESWEGGKWMTSRVPVTLVTALALVVLIPLIAGVIVWIVLGINLEVSDLRDALLVLVMVESFVALLILLIAAFYVIRFMNLLQKEVLPILASARRSSMTVQSATTVITDSAIGPVLRIAGAGLKLPGYILGLFSRFSKRGGGR